MPNQDSVDFTKLLVTLDPDSDRAAKEYNRLYRALTRYLQNHGSWSPEEHADETLEILCRKITEGVSIIEINSYARAVASNVLKRAMQKERKFESLENDPINSPQDLSTRHTLVELVSFEAWQESETKEPEELQQAKGECLRICWKKLPVEDRQLMMEYDPRQGHDRVRREALAKQYGITPNQLRVTIHRIRERLRRCYDDCLNTKST